jgi:Kdo2-lipid IVA lauroyltransferase/acyltransferase
MISNLVYHLLLGIVRLLQALPVRFVAGAGRAVGSIVHLLDGRHRWLAHENLRRCFPEMSAAERTKVVKEHFRRLGENFAAAIPTAGMSNEEIARHLEVVGAEKLKANPRGAIVAIGHFGNFELYTHLTAGLPAIRGAATYRALQHKCLNRLVGELRRRSGCLFFDRDRDVKPMLNALREGGIVLGLLSDQYAGRRGAQIPFFGHPCSTSIALAKLAERYDLPLFTAVCFRVALGRWRIEVGDEVPTQTAAGPRPSAEVMADVHGAFEKAIRRDLPNWFWVYDRWRFAKAARAEAKARRSRQDGESNTTDRAVRN